MGGEGWWRAVNDGELAARYQPDMEVNLSQLIGLFQGVEATKHLMLTQDC